MSDAEINTEDFAANVRRGDFRKAIAEVMGQNPIGIERTKRFLIEFNRLDSAHRESMLSWSILPAERLPVNGQKWYVEKIARHEMAHIVVAKALGFSTGGVTLVLHSPDGSHQGTSSINLDCPTPSLSEVSAYLDQRVIILLAGYIAEPADASERQSCAYLTIQSKRGESDLQKAWELIRVKLNIEGISRPNAINEILHILVPRALTIVEANFSVISALAQRFADLIDFYEQPIGWEGSEIDKQPEIQQIVKAQ
jgi:hypothetical protein